jgi:D-3-phosphoglycerate dehydrogenase
MRILAVGDSYMPARYFAEAFAELRDAHQIRCAEVTEDPSFHPSSASERSLREYQGSPAELAGWMEGVEVLAVHGAPVTDEVLDASAELRLVCCARGGPVNVDVAALSARGLPLVNTPGKNAEAVADLTLAFLVMLARRLPRAQRFLEEGNRVRDNWDGAQFIGSDLRGHTLGLVGYGQVGSRVAERARAFGMTVLVHDPYARTGDGGPQQLETLAELLERSDFVSLHARASAENWRMIDAGAIASMRPGACLINTARESLLDEDALDDALRNGHLGGAALDVVEADEGAGRHRLLRHENVVLTPHVGGATRETLAQGAQMIAVEIAHLAAGEALVNVLNSPAAAP